MFPYSKISLPDGYDIQRFLKIIINGCLYCLSKNRDDDAEFLEKRFPTYTLSKGLGLQNIKRVTTP